MSRVITHIMICLMTSLTLCCSVLPAAHAQTAGRILAPTDTAPDVQLVSGRDAPPVAPSIRFTRNPASDQPLDSLKALPGETIHFGTQGVPILLTLPLSNSGERAGTWVLTTGRGALRSIRISSFDTAIGTPSSIVHLDSAQAGASRRNLRTYQAFSTELTLEPGERRTVVIEFLSDNSTYMPIQIQTYGSFFADRRTNIALVSGVVIGALVLIVLNALFFGLTGKREFAWLAAAELAFTFHTVHAEGYTTIFLFPEAPGLSMAFGDITRAAFAAFMAQFGRQFLNTPRTLPKLDLVLRAVVWGGAAVIILSLFRPLWGEPIRAAIFAGAWVTAAVSALVLPFVGIRATLSLDRNYWPLILAWGSLGLFIVYSAVASAGLIPNLPIRWHWAGPIGLFEGVMATLALGLYVRKIELDRRASQAELTQSLQSRLEISERAQRLSEERAAALATIDDQNSLLHASGHDSRQVVSALRSAVAYVEGGETVDSSLASLLEASAGHLEDIVSTTLSTPMTTLQTSGTGMFIALSAATLEPLLKPIARIYETLCRDAGLEMRVDYDPTQIVITDRALVTRALSNLIGNAVKFTHTGHIHVRAEVQSDQLLIRVRDTGSGIAPDTAARIHARAFGRLRGESAASGTGSGVQATQAIMDALGGSLDIGAAPAGQGTLATLRLPLVPTTLTPCGVEALDGALIQAELRDADLGGTQENRALPDGQILIMASYDDRPEMRRRISGQAPLMLVKPLALEMAHHPCLRAAQSSSNSHTPDLAES